MGSASGLVAHPPPYWLERRGINVWRERAGNEGTPWAPETAALTALSTGFDPAAPPMRGWMPSHIEYPSGRWVYSSTTIVAAAK